MSPSKTSMAPMRNSPTGKHIGVLPAQQPPDWMNITGPPRTARRRRIASRAAGVAVMRARAIGSDITGSSEQPERFTAVADEEVLRLAVVIQHHAVVLPADAGDLVATECGTCRVLVIAVRPDATGLDAAAHLVRPAAIPGPDTGAQPVEAVIRDRQRVRVIGERGDRKHGAEDLLLEHPHLVVALQHRRLEVIAVREFRPVHAGALAADEHLGALVAADVYVGGDFLDLLR